MPNYRGAAAGAFSGLSDFFGYLIQQKVAQEERDRYRQAEQQRAMEYKLLESLQKPEIALRAQEMGMESVGGLPIGLFAPSERERTGEMLEQIGKADDLAALRTDQETIAGLKSRGINTTPGIEKTYTPGQGGSLTAAHFNPTSVGPTGDVLRALSSRREQLTANQPTTQVNSYDPQTGASQTRFVPQNQLSGLGPVQTSPTPEQKGEDWLEEQQAGPLSPGAIAGANRVEAGTRAEKVRTAGSLAAASARGRLDVELNPAIVAREVEKVKQIAIAEAAAKRDAEGAQDAQAAAQQAVPALSAMKVMKALYDQIAPTNQWTALGRTTQSYVSPLYQANNPKAAELDSLREASAPIFFSLFGGKGQQSDKDIKGILSAIPGGSTLKKVGDQQWKDLNALVVIAPLAAAHLRNKSVAERVAVGQRWVELIKKAPKGVTEIIDPDTGIIIPVLN